MLYTRKQLAELLNIKPRTIWHWEKKKLIEPLIYVNGRPRYELESVLNFLEINQINQIN